MAGAWARAQGRKVVSAAEHPSGTRTASLGLGHLLGRLTRRRGSDSEARGTSPCPADSPGDCCVVLWSWQVGDQILEVNGQSFLNILHDEAVRLLKSSQHLILTVKDVGRLPHARTTVDETKWIASSRIGDTASISAGSGHTAYSGPRDHRAVSEGRLCPSRPSTSLHVPPPRLDL